MFFLCRFFCFLLPWTLLASASAGSLELRLLSVNGPETSVSIDSRTGEVTIDRPDPFEAQPGSSQPADHQSLPAHHFHQTSFAIVATERVITADHPLRAVIELNVRLDGGSKGQRELLPQKFLVRVRIQGATFFRQLNGEDVIRQGNVDSADYTADVLGLTGDPGSQLAELFVENHAENRQQDFGLVLPLEISGTTIEKAAPCDPVSVSVHVFSISGFGAPQPIGAPESLDIIRCAPAFSARRTASEVDIDFQTGFRSFLDGDHRSVQRARVGNIDLRLLPYLFDPRVSEASALRRASLDHISEYILTLKFEDLTGIASVRLVLGKSGWEIEGDLDRQTGTVTFRVPGSALAASAETILHRVQSDGVALPGPDFPVDRFAAAISVSAFPPDTPDFIETAIITPKGDITTRKIPTGVGPIQAQTITIIDHHLKFAQPCKDDDETAGGVPIAISPMTAKYWCRIILERGALGTLSRTGEYFGDFDWVMQANRPHGSFFRLTNVPLVDEKGAPRRYLEGMLRISNIEKDIGNSAKILDIPFTLPFDGNRQNEGANGVYLIGPMRLRKMLVDANVPTDFGSADISFTFFVGYADQCRRTAPDKKCSPSDGNSLDTARDRISLTMDMDRLVLSRGRMVAYGDNANDQSSVGARTGEVGRFGSKAPIYAPLKK